MGGKIPEKVSLNILQKKLVQRVAAKRAAIRVANELLEAEQFRVFDSLAVDAQIVAAWLLRINALGQFFSRSIKPVMGVNGAYLKLLDAREQEIGKSIDCAMLDSSSEFAEQVASQLYAHYEDEVLQKSISGKKHAWTLVVFQGEEEQARWSYGRHHGGDLCGESDHVQAIIALARRMGLYDHETGKRHKEYTEAIFDELMNKLEGRSPESGF